LAARTAYDSGRTDTMPTNPLTPKRRTELRDAIAGPGRWHMTTTDAVTALPALLDAADEADRLRLELDHAGEIVLEALSTRPQYRKFPRPEGKLGEAVDLITDRDRRFEVMEAEATRAEVAEREAAELAEALTMVRRLAFRRLEDLAAITGSPNDGHPCWRRELTGPELDVIDAALAKHKEASRG
jgi:hypothetical protein